MSRLAQAARGNTAQRMYHGWTTGKKTTNTSVEIPRPPIGWMLPRYVARSMRNMNPVATSTPTARVKERIASVWSPKPKSIPRKPAPTPTAVLEESQERMLAAPPWPVIQPSPMPDASVTMPMDRMRMPSWTAVALAMAPRGNSRAAASTLGPGPCLQNPS